MHVAVSNHPRLTSLICLFFFLPCAKAVYADQVRSSDVIVTANACVGTDCANSENLESTTLRLKENNTRIRFFNTASPDTLGKSWSLEANDSSNGGPSTFRFKAQSLTQDAIKLSDGQDVGVDCSPGEPIITDFNVQPAQAVVPLGQPVYRAMLVRSFSEGGESKSEYSCEEQAWWTEELLLRLGREADNLITLGQKSAPVADAVSVGNVTQLRKVRHVAESQSRSDVLNVRSLSLFPERVARIKNLRRSISTMETRVTALENADADNDGVRNIDDAFPTDPNESADADGDGIGDNADDFVNAVTTARYQNLTLTSTPQSASSSCSIDSFSASPVDNERAPGPAIAQQADFVLRGCAPGETVIVSIDFGEAFPPRAAAFKVSAGNWERIDGAAMDGQTITYAVQDNGPLDLDPADGVIRDPVSVASAPIEPIPLPPWLLLTLTACLGGLGLARVRRHNLRFSR